MKEIPLHFFRIQKTDRYVRFKFGQLNIYFSWKPLRTRPQNRDIGTAKNKRKALKHKLLNRGGYCEICGKPLVWETASVHHIVPYSQDPSKEFDINNLQLLCCDCHVRVHQIADSEAKKNRLCSM